MSLVKVNVTVDLQNEEQLKADSLRILSVIRPDWSADNVCWRVFTDGITNKLVGAWHGDSREDTVLVRVYGLGTEKIIDRNMEMVNMMAYQRLGGSKLYATFNNGICYQVLTNQKPASLTSHIAVHCRGPARPAHAAGQRGVPQGGPGHGHAPLSHHQQW
mgnify:CR=1 FL=1